MAGPNAGRSGGRWRKLHADLKAQRHPLCWICWQPIRYDLEWPDPASFSVDHHKPRSTHPELAEDPANLKPVHLGCNSSKQDGATPKPSLGSTSRAW